MLAVAPPVAGVAPFTAGLGEPVWERLPGEPPLWHDRFCHFRDQGPHRTLKQVYREEREEAHPGQPMPQLGTRWFEMARCAIQKLGPHLRRLAVRTRG
jgi:hypothetical protein